MTETAHDPASNAGLPGQDDLAAVILGLQEQITDLTRVAEDHQRLFERLRADGLLRSDAENSRHDAAR